MNGGSKDDIYVWISAVPNDLVPTVTSGAVRSERMYGFDIIGRVADLPPERRGKDARGCYMHDLFATDAKVNSWAQSMALPFMTKALAAWHENYRDYLSKNQ